MDDAARALGGTIVLPSTSQVTPADAGTVWMNQLHGDTNADNQTGVAVTFPSQGLIIRYERPSIADPLAYIQESVKEASGSQLIWLGEVPAWSIPEPTDGSNWAAIEFVAGGATIDVLGITNEASLQAIAQSIVDRAAPG